MGAKRIVSIGTLTFTHKPTLTESLEPSDFTGETMMSAAGSHITYVQRITTPYRTVDSLQSGWLTEAEKDELLTLYDVIGGTHLVTYDDASSETCRFIQSENTKLKITPLFEGACMYTAHIPMATV